MTKIITLLLCLFISLSAFAQIINDQAPYVLTIAQLKAWTQTGTTADPALIAAEPLATRFIETATQFNPNLSNDMQIAYLPDGMNNFANYGSEQTLFNLYNFTHWSYIDQLIWFGGTADQTVQLPSAPWTNTAHKNGVKVLGNVFFAPNAFGGSTATMLNFLEQDSNDNFVVIPIMIDIMEYYNFDGWFINEETSTNASTAQLMYEFLRDLTTQVEALGKEVMWYDAMTLTGAVGWQNQLNANNSPFVQNDEDGDSSNGFEQRVSSSIFINFFWGGSTLPLNSRDRAAEISRTEFEVFTGVDLWPGRNQGLFETVGNAWMGWLHESPTVPITSLGLFAPNCVFNNSDYSNFNNDPLDVGNFYSQERHMFSGADRNPRIEDISGFKGYTNWIPAASTITQIPFETNFNTGHGLKKFEEGIETSSSSWHNINDQDLLPTWQFAFSANNAFSGVWDFDTAYNGGSSLKVEGTILSSSPEDLLLYKTKLLLTPDSKIDLVYSYDSTEDDYTLELILTFSDAPLETVALDVSSTENGWIPKTRFLNAYAGRELATIGLRMNGPIIADGDDYRIHIGNIKVHEGEPLAVEDQLPTLEELVTIAYPKEKDLITIYIDISVAQQLSLALYNLQGQLINTAAISGQSTYQLNTAHFAQGIYLLVFENDEGTKVTKKIVVQ